MSFALHPNKVRLPPLYAMFNDDDLAPAPGARSHAKKKPASYIPRPKNAFIIFRTLYSKWNATLPRVADPNNPDQSIAISDHRSLSKHAGEAWRCMTEDEKAPYKDLADEDKAQHRINYPDYKYSPGERAPSKKITKKGKPEQRSESPPSSVTSDGVDQSIVDEVVTLYQPPRRRSSSCPPTASQSWNIALPQPFTFQQPDAGPAPVFTNPWSNSLCSPDDAFSQIPEQRSLDPASSWRRGSKDDFAVSYGQSRGLTPNPPLCNSMGEFARRVSRYDTSFNSYTPSSLSTALLPPREHVWPEMPLREVPFEFSSNAHWDRKKSRDDLDMHLFGHNVLVPRPRRSQDVRKASIDDFGINYGSSRPYGWNQGFDTAVDLNPLKMTIPNEYHTHGLEDPSSAISPLESSTSSIHDFSPLDGFGPLSPFIRQQMPSGYMTMHLDQNIPQPVMNLEPSHVAPLELIEHELDETSSYSAYAVSPEESYSYSEFLRDHDVVHDLPNTPSRDTTATPEYMQAMSIYQEGLVGVCSQT